MPYSLFTRSALRSRSHKFMALLVAFALVFDLASGAAWNVPVAFAHDSGEPHEEEFQGSQKGQQDGDGEEDEGAPFEEEQDSSENCGNSGTSGEGCDEQGNSGDNEGDDRGVTEEKVTICHLPPGNPENAQGITISVNAAQLPGHLQHGDSVGSCEVPPPTTDTGTIRICKVIASEDGVLATSSDGLPGGSFSVGLSYGFTPSSAMPYATATWSTMSFMPDTDLIGHDGVNDAVCVSYGALPIGSYYYDEEFLSGDGEWLAPKYNDQYTHPFDDLSDLFAYSPALFTADPSDDNAREQNADGHIVLSKNQTRTLVVLNTYGDEDVPPPPPTPVCGNGVIEPLIGESCDDGNLISGDGCSNQCRVEPIVPPASCSLTLVSDTSNIVVGGGNAVATYDDNPAWTAMIPGATWIWKTFFVSTPSINETTIFEKAFAIDRPVATATLAIAADNSYEITLNGTPFAADLGEYNYRESGKDIYDFASALASGTNTLRISVKNWGIPGSSAQSNPAGLLYRLEVAYGGQGCVDTPPPVCSDDLDNDGDGIADFPTDPGCDTPTDNDENEKPVITVLGDNPMDILLGATFTDPGATAADPEDGNITSSIVATGTVNTLAIGTYTITYTVSDSDGLAADPKTRTVRVVQAPVCSDGVDNDGDAHSDFPTDPGCDTPTDNDENEKPMITVLGADPMTLTLGSTFTDPSATVADPEDGDITAKLVTTGTVNTGIVGSYTLTYNATDSDNMAADPKTRTVIVATVCSDGRDNDGDGKADFPLDPGCGDPTDDSENTPPVVTLLGATPISVIVGTLFTDPGATALDLEDGTLTPSVSGSVNTSVIGAYLLTYGAMDSDGATATPVMRAVNVIPEPTVPPVCSDDLDNDGDGIADFPTDLGCDTPTDNDENEKPVITVLGDNPMDILLGATFTDPGATAADPEDGNITSSIVATGTVNTLAIGTYTITYTVSDSDGLAADPKTRTVRVVSACSDGRDNDGDEFVDFPADTGCDDPTDDSENEKPVITLLGDVLMTMFAGGTFTDPSATAADPEDGDITAKLVTTGTVNTGIVGSYTLTYNATDSDNMAADPKTRTVQVLTAPCTVNCGGGGTPPVCSDGSDNDADGFADYPRDPGCSSSEDPDERDGDPTITVLGDNPMTVTRGGTFTDPGATASDPDDGNITSRIVATGTVNMSTTGTYTIRYNVTDTAGHPAPEKTRTVNVVDPSNPGCTANCGGGGGGPTPLSIMNERLSVTSSSTALVTWNTNLPATSRVVYGGASVPVVGSAPMYGYPVTTATSTALTTSHAIAIDVRSGLPYFFRPASSDGRSEVRGIELAHVPGATLPEPCFYLRDYLRLGANNDPLEVRKLQAFLHDLEGHATLEVTGFFDTTTDLAVRAFQEKYRADVLDPWALPAPTGYVYYTTQKKVNEIYCARAFPLNGLQESEIAEFRTLMQTLLANPGSASGVTVPLVGTNVGAGGTGSNGTPFAPEVAERLAAGIPAVGEEGSVAGTSSVAEATEDGEAPRKGGRISIESLLAVTPSATTALSGQAQASGTASTTPKTTGALAAVAGSFAEKMNIPVWSLYLSSLILFVAVAIAAWILLRSREEDETPAAEAAREMKR